MKKMSELEINELLGNSIKCSCGREHKIDIDDILISSGAVNLLPGVLEKNGFKKALMVTDDNCYKAAGKQVDSVLSAKIEKLETCILKSSNSIVPDEFTIGSVMAKIDDSVDLIIAVGSGTINDLCKYVSNRCKIPYIIVITAPSMDGFASVGSALIIDNLKTTYEAGFPKVIIADTDIIKNAPLNMIFAGLGDMLGKYTSLCDWELGRIINNEYYCPSVIEMVRESVKKCIGDTEGIKNRKIESIENLVAGLVLIGIAMGFVRNSRPASGSEHHLSHYFEMMSLMNNKTPVLHGIEVGVTAVVILKLYDMLLSAHVDFNEARDKINRKNIRNWTDAVHGVFGKASNAIVEQNLKENKYNKSEYIKRVNAIENNWDDILSTIKIVIPENGIIEKILKDLGASHTPAQIGISRDSLCSGIRMSKEIRTRYTILQLLDDIGLLDSFSEKVSDFFFKKPLNIPGM